MFAGLKEGLLLEELACTGAEMISAVASKRILIMGLGDVMVSERGLGLRCPRHSQDHSPFGEGACFFLVWIQPVPGGKRVK